LFVFFLKTYEEEERKRERGKRGKILTPSFLFLFSLQNIFFGFTTAAAGPPTPPGGAPPAAAQAAAAEVLPTLAHALKRDPDAAAAAAAGGAAAEVVEVVGAAAAPYADALGDAAGAVLSGTARALGSGAGSDSDGEELTVPHGGGGGDDDDDDGEEEEERGDAEALLLGAAADILPALARALGPDAFAPVFDARHAALLATRMAADQPDEVRAAAVGAFADVALALGARAARHAAAAAPALLRELRSPNDLCRRNAAYAAGAAVASAPEAFAPHAGHLLEALAPLLHPSSASCSNDPGVGDNAAGALARALLALPAGSLPAEAVLPALLSRVRPEGSGCLGDPAEAEPIMRALAAVVGVPPGAAAAAAEPFVGRAAAALAAAAADADAPPPVRVAAARGLVAAAAARPEIAAPLVAALPEAVRAELEALAARGGV